MLFDDFLHRLNCFKKHIHIRLIILAFRSIDSVVSTVCSVALLFLLVSSVISCFDISTIKLF